VETVISGGLWNTLVDPYQVENALLNLAINARDAMEGHGKLTIEAGNAQLDDDYAARHAEVRAGQYVMLAVSDTGCGMDKELVLRAFEPFFTTKPEGQGTGLGLSMVYGFVRQTGGHVKIYSEPGMGTTVRLYLPRANQAEDQITELDASDAEGGDETVLVVEDDEDVRTTVVEMLADLGYRVLKAADAQSAMSIIESGVNVDLLFTDVVMPGPLRSRDVALRARARLPRLAVLFTSGYADNAIVHGGRLDEGIELLSKPYTAATLARKLRQVLRARPQASGLRSDTALPTTALAKRVLLVEDMEAVRLTTEEILGSLGHEVIHAATAAQASEQLLQHHIDILLTDVGLPDGSGIDLAVWARTRQPTLAVVFSSGRDVLADASTREGLNGVHQLLKPYSPQQLERVFAMLVQPAGHAERG
jgi:CheY-like chemotaxis protein